MKETGRNHRLGGVYLAFAASIWGGTYVVSKVVLDVVPPLTLVWLRYVLALVTLLTAGIFVVPSWRIKKVDVAYVVAIGLVGYVVSIGAQFIGTKLATAQMGAVITSSTPTFMALFAVILLKERITARKATSLMLATVGVLIIAGLGQAEHASILGGGILIVAALSWALMSILIKKLKGHYSSVVITTYAMGVATAVLSPFAWAGITQVGISSLMTTSMIFSLLYLGIISTAVAFYLWNKGMRLVEGASSGVYFFFQPIVGTILGWLLLGEHISTGFWIGSACVVFGVVLVMGRE